MKKAKLVKPVRIMVSAVLSVLVVATSIPLTCSAASTEIWQGYPGTDQLTATDTISNPFKFFNVKNDPNGDGYVSNTSEWTARKTEIKDLVQHYWLGYRWPTQAKDVVGEDKTLSDPNVTGGFSNLNLGTEFKKLVETLKTSKVEIKKIIPPAGGGFGSSTLGDVVTTIGPAKDPSDATELQNLAIQAWNAGYYVPYSFYGMQFYAVMKDSTGAITTAPGETKLVAHHVITITNPDSGAKSSFSISVAMPTADQIKKVWGSENAKVPFVVDIGGASAMSAANLNPQGYALVSFNATDIYPDDSEAKDGINRKGVYTDLYPYNKDKYEYASGAEMAWGWGVSQIISAMGQPTAGGTQTYGNILGLDPTKTVVTGHSRYGKAAMFAGAFDERISVCIPSESGGSGIQSYRYKVEGKIFGFNTTDYAKADRVYGSTEVPSISYGSGTSWFPETAANFVGKDNQLPFDADDIIALVAPRPFYTVTGIDTHWLGNEGGVASVLAASEVYNFIGKNETEKTNIAIQARESDHVFYPRDFCYALAIMDRTFKQGSSDQKLHVQDLFPTGTGKNGMSLPAKDYQGVSEFNSYPFDINSSYLPWSSANKYTLWTAQENFLTGRSATITAHSDAPDVDLYSPDKKTKIDAAKHEGDTFTFNLTPEQSVYGRYELRTMGSSKENKSVYFAAVSLSDSLRHATSKGDQGEENRMIGFASRLANTASDAPQVYLGGSATPISMCFTTERFPKEETSLKEYGILFHDNLFKRIATEGWNDAKTFDIKNLKFVTIPGFNFELSFNKVYASDKDDGKDGAAKFTQPISWNVEKYNNGSAAVWPVLPNTTAERTTLDSGKTVTRPDAPTAKTTNFKASVTGVNTVFDSDKTNVVINFSEALDKAQFGFGMNAADKWKTVWNEDGTQVTLSIANSDLKTNAASGDLIIFRLMDKSGNQLGGPIEKTFNLTPPTPTIPTVITNAKSNVVFDLSGVKLPASVTSVSVGDSTLQNTVSDTSICNAIRDLANNDKTLGKIEKLVVHNLKLLDQNGNPITGFTGKIKVKIPIPDGMSGNLHVLWYDDSTGKLSDMHATVDGKFLVFETDHFSYYAVAQLASAGSTSGSTSNSGAVNSTTSPKTGDSTSPILYAALLCSAMLSAIYLMIIRKKRISHKG